MVSKSKLKRMLYFRYDRFKLLLNYFEIVPLKCFKNDSCAPLLLQWRHLARFYSTPGIAIRIHSALNRCSCRTSMKTYYKVVNPCSNYISIGRSDASGAIRCFCSFSSTYLSFSLSRRCQRGAYVFVGTRQGVIDLILDDVVCEFETVDCVGEHE